MTDTAGREDTAATRDSSNLFKNKRLLNNIIIGKAAVNHEALIKYFVNLLECDKDSLYDLSSYTFSDVFTAPLSNFITYALTKPSTDFSVKASDNPMSSIQDRIIEYFESGLQLKMLPCGAAAVLPIDDFRIVIQYLSKWLKNADNSENKLTFPAERSSFEDLSFIFKTSEFNTGKATFSALVSALSELNASAYLLHSTKLPSVPVVCRVHLDDFVTINNTRYTLSFRLFGSWFVHFCLWYISDSNVDVVFDISHFAQSTTYSFVNYSLVEYTNYAHPFGIPNSHVCINPYVLHRASEAALGKLIDAAKQAKSVIEKRNEFCLTYRKSMYNEGLYPGAIISECISTGL